MMKVTEKKAILEMAKSDGEFVRHVPHSRNDKGHLLPESTEVVFDNMIYLIVDDTISPVVEHKTESVDKDYYTYITDNWTGDIRKKKWKEDCRKYKFTFIEYQTVDICEDDWDEVKDDYKKIEDYAQKLAVEETQNRCFYDDVKCERSE
jgi:hypothetical protein